MTDPIAALNALRRPRPLVQAARYALDEYVRERALPRLLHAPGTLEPRRALALLLAAEAAAEAERRAGTLSYSAARHIELLAAVMGEARLATAAARPAAAADRAPAAPGPQAKASGISDLRRAT